MKIYNGNKVFSEGVNPTFDVVITDPILNEQGVPRVITRQNMSVGESRGLCLTVFCFDQVFDRVLEIEVVGNNVFAPGGGLSRVGLVLKDGHNVVEILAGQLGLAEKVVEAACEMRSQLGEHEKSFDEAFEKFEKSMQSGSPI